ncbi:MAG: hypothetical protein K0M45_05700, partial [Candidatus Paracaedibacteraceae bacterium]|nr:hypothetical protein [Candidatus Paracaedibacteraceae bacterium]
GQRQSFINSAKQLFTSDMRGDAQASIITALAQVEADQRQDFIDSVKQLFTSDMRGDERASIITALAQVEADQRHSVIDSAKQLFTSYMGGYEGALIIRALAQVEAGQRHSVVQAAKQLVTSEMRGDERASIITALAQVEAGQRQSFIDSVKQLFTVDMSGYGRASIIAALAQVDTDQWQSFIDSAKQLLMSEMRGDDQASIIEALVQVETDQRQSVAQAAKQLITVDMRGYERASIIAALAQVKADQRQSFIDSVKQLFTVDMRGYEQVSIIEALAKVEAGQRQSVAQAAKQLVTPRMRGYERASIIEALAKVEAGQRQSVIDSAKQLVTFHMGGEERASIITALAQVKAGQRQNVIDSAKPLITSDMDGQEQALIIFRICKEIKATSRQGVAQVPAQPVAVEKRGSGEDAVSQTQFVIDLGSSGVQLGGFKINLEKKIVGEQVFSKKERILLQAAIHNRILPDDVRKRTENAIKTLLAEAGINPDQTKVVGFATAWARAADNSNQLIEAIKSETNVTITIIDQQIEGEIGFNATLAALRSLLLDRESFLYQTENGKEILGKMTGNNPDNPLIPQTIMSWDIGGGSMQLAKQNNDNRIEVIGSTDASTTFANAVIELKRDMSEEEESLSQEILPLDTPNPLSRAQVREVINLAREKAARFIDHSFLDGLKAKTVEVFGIGLMHKSNREYINKLLGLNWENFYRKVDLEEAVGLLTDKGDREIAHALGIKESDVRNRLTSMLL